MQQEARGAGYRCHFQKGQQQPGLRGGRTPYLLQEGHLTLKGSKGKFQGRRISTEKRRQGCSKQQHECGDRVWMPETPKHQAGPWRSRDQSREVWLDSETDSSDLELERRRELQS